MPAPFTNLTISGIKEDSVAGAGFESLFLEHYSTIVNVILRVIGDRAQAEELAADVFWKLHRQPFAAGREHNIGGWLYRTAIRAGLDALRADSRRARREQQAGHNGHSQASGDPLDQLLRDQQRARVRSVLAAMNPRQAELLALRSHGLAYKELADALQLNPNSIGTLLARAEDDFERRYRAQYGDEDL